MQNRCHRDLQRCLRLDLSWRSSPPTIDSTCGLRVKRSSTQAMGKNAPDRSRSSLVGPIEECIHTRVDARCGTQADGLLERAQCVLAERCLTIDEHHAIAQRAEMKEAAVDVFPTDAGPIVEEGLEGDPCLRAGSVPAHVHVERHTVERDPQRGSVLDWANAAQIRVKQHSFTRGEKPQTQVQQVHPQVDECATTAKPRIEEPCPFGAWAVDVVEHGAGGADWSIDSVVQGRYGLQKSVAVIDD